MGSIMHTCNLCYELAVINRQANIYIFMPVENGNQETIYFYK